MKCWKMVMRLIAIDLNDKDKIYSAMIFVLKWIYALK